MVRRNPNFHSLSANYLFPEIQKRKKEFLKINPDIELINLGIGDTTQPLSASITKAFERATNQLGTLEGYLGYGPEQGIEPLRKKIAHEIYNGLVDFDEVYVSDGAKCDIGRLQLLFGKESTILIQDPAYPVYVDGSVIQGHNGINYMPCTANNSFFPDLSHLPKTDLIYFCSPNNPTGEAANHAQLKSLVDYAKANRSIIIYDSAYSCFIQNDKYPKSIFEIEGAREVAIETSSFSKMAGFTGVRLGWTVVPKELKFDDGLSVKADWHRLISTVFNGASNIAQLGGLAALESEGLEEIKRLSKFYLTNARNLKEPLINKGYSVFGGEHAPYLWVYFPGKTSWDIFQNLLEKFHLVTTPGSGFGPGGEGYIRLSAFGHQLNIQKAVEKFKSSQFN